MNKLFIGALFMSPSLAMAAVDTTAVVAEISGGTTTAVTAIAAAVLILAAVYQGFKWAGRALGR